MKKFNINDPIYIQITDEGWKHLKQTVNEEYINNTIIPRKIVINDENWYKLTCWNVFDLFPPNFGGPTLFNANIMFENNHLKEIVS